ncbi:glycosyltransferase [Microbulbifer sp. JMSA003]|uniref:glycosyltransferase n=1 Tax=Microbulbifer sp. JMSA003 TaxID=3243369 RepID=UPI0040392835
MSDRFSIIMPCYNDSDLLYNLLQGYTLQTFPKENFEIIIVDNNSQDPNILSCYNQFKNHLTLTLLFRPQLPDPFALNSARNLGVKIAKYEWCVFTDSDCIPAPNYLAEIQKIINDYGPSICMTGIREFIHSKDIDPAEMDGDGKYLDAYPRFNSPSNYGLSKDRRLGKIEQLPNTEHPWGHFYGCNMVFKRQDVIKVGFFDEKYDGTWGYDDIDLAYRVINELKVQPIFMKEAIVYHQDNINLTETINGKRNKIKDLSNPNYQYICKRISGYYEFSNREFKRFGLTTTAS